MKPIVYSALASLALAGAAHAESSFSYGNIDLSYIKAVANTKLFAADDTDYVTLKSDYRPDGFEAKLSVPFADHFFYELSYSTIEDKLANVSASGFTLPIGSDVEQNEGRLGLGYIFSLSEHTDIFVKGMWIEGEIAAEDYDGFLLGGGVRQWLLPKLELNAEAGFGKVEIDEDADVLELKISAYYHFTDNVAVGLGYTRTEIDDPDTNDPDIILFGVEEQQTLKASLRFSF